jgi:TPR repeat protein
MTNLGYAYEIGRGVTQSDVEAAAWYRKGAERGNVFAMSNLGSLYEEGKGGLPKSDRDAAEWYRKAAQLGYAPAMFNMGRLCENNRRDPASMAHAVSWYRLAADYHYDAAKVNLGDLYLRGWGVSRNRDTALQLFTEAAQSSDPTASAAGRRSRDEMTQNSISSGALMFGMLAAAATARHPTPDEAQEEQDRQNRRLAGCAILSPTDPLVRGIMGCPVPLF